MASAEQFVANRLAFCIELMEKSSELAALVERLETMGDEFSTSVNDATFDAAASSAAIAAPELEDLTKQDLANVIGSIGSLSAFWDTHKVNFMKFGTRDRVYGE